MVKLRMDEILYIESVRDYVKITTSGKELTVHQSISYLEERLPEHFLRVHRSFIVAVPKIESYSSQHIELSGNIEIPIGRTYKNSALKTLDSHIKVL